MKKQSAAKLVTTVRFTESQRADYEAVARLEGFDSVIQWMLKLADRRVVIVNEAIESGQYVTVGNAKVPLSDMDQGDLARAADLLLSARSNLASSAKPTKPGPK